MNDQQDWHPREEQLRDLLGGRLDDNQAKAVQQHVESCQACGELFRKITLAEDSLAKNLGQMSHSAEAATNSSPQALLDAPTEIKPPEAEAFREADTLPPGPPPDTASPARAASLAAPSGHIGRYRIEKVLGQGGFGAVYLGYDDQLQRKVAIKVPTAEHLKTDSDVEEYLAEARVVASLDHPQIVPVYDVGRTEEGLCYVVSKFVESGDLAQRIEKGRPSLTTSLKWVMAVAKALGYAHQQGVVHRDIKPANILLDGSGKPYLADFGLALKDEEVGQGPEFGGTPAYMSPEQARGEAHRVDGRSDIFSLGVVLYELLTGRRPFKGDTPLDIILQVMELEVRPPRQWDSAIPKELERICLKMLCKRAADRYSAAGDVVDDLRHFLSQREGKKTKTEQPAADHPIKIVPKGLRSFDANDADFFLELLPGPHDRDGLPESLRFWKTRIEETDPDQTFSVGLIYGPSGCGKSSLMKAGLLPRLADHVQAIYVEATAEDTEQRILHLLQKRFPDLPTNQGLEKTLAELRRGKSVPAGHKTLIVIDQFEQWLHAQREQENNALVRAMRQCDGGHLQCIVMVRDDFWMATTRFMDDLEVGLVKGQNMQPADLFDPLHARKVLAEFGRAYGRLPGDSKDLPTSQQGFLDSAVDGLSQEGRVVCVRLALFAEMIKGRPWTPETLHQVGGAEGLGVAFLEETFSAATASPKHRLHQRAARGVLKTLLPQPGTDIKGNLRSHEELLEASGYARREKDFEELIRILDSEIRLITPTDPEGAANDEEAPSAAEAKGKYYQLTHDYLVPSLRQWLTRKQKETRRGRAELRLAERSATWNAKLENRHLPSWWEYVNIRLFTSKTNWTERQSRMMQKAGRVHRLRGGSALLVALLIAFSTYRIGSRIGSSSHFLERTETAVAALSTSRGVFVPRAIADLDRLPREIVLTELRLQFATGEESRKLSLAYALAHYGQVEVDFLAAQVEHASPDEAANLVASLDKSKAESIFALQQAARRADPAINWRNHNWRPKARLAILALHLDNTSLASNMCQLRPDPIQRTIFIDEFWTWHGELAALARQIADSEDIPLRSAVALGVGGVPVADVTSSAKGEWRNVLSNWYQNQSDTTTHSAAGWALRKWKIEPPKIAVSKQPAAGNDWHVNSVGMTMLKIPAGRFVRKFGTKKQEVVISRPFLFCDGEVTRRQFQQFMDDPDYPAKEKPKNWSGRSEQYTEQFSPTKDHPVPKVTWYDAILFCNWLSHKEGLKPCYERTGEKEKFDAVSHTYEYDAWRLNLETDGYRLPTEAEWEYACRSGAATFYSYGNDGKLMDRYAVYLASQTEIPGSKLPNGWGLFDVHGNLWEWCHDWDGGFTSEAPVKDPMGPAKGTGRVLRGGSFNSSGALGLRCDQRRNFRPDLRLNDVFGFRPARTYH